MPCTDKINSSPRSKGFTLIELMIAVSIFTIFIVFVYRFFFDEYRSYISVQKQNDLQYNANTGVDYIVQALRNNPDLVFEDGCRIIRNGSGHIIIDLTGTGSSGDLNYSAAEHSLKDNAGNTLCNFVDNIAINLDGTGMPVLDVRITLASTEGGREVRYSAGTSINYEK